MIWFTSDTHFGHGNILHFGRGRPFTHIDNHDATLIANWNDCVGPSDTVYHLGDFALCNKSRMAECWHALRGRKFHVPGNHDHEPFKHMVESFAGMGAQLLPRMCTFKLDKERAELCHFPMEVWNRCHHGAFHLHGHSHDNLNTRPNAKRLDVGVDAAARLLGSYRPFSWDEIRAIMAQRSETKGADHHGSNDSEGTS